MFLIEYGEGLFFNAEDIHVVCVSEGRVIFYTKCHPNYMFEVDKDYERLFLNHLQTLNENTTNIQARYKELNSPERLKVS